MSETHDEARALRVMVEELKAEPVPELPWEAIEQRLMTRVAESEQGGRRGRTGLSRVDSPLWRVVGLAAAAAAIALGVSSGGRHEQASSPAREPRHVEASQVALAPGEAGARGERDLRALDKGDVIETADAPITFARAGLVAWTLAPHSTVRVRSMGDASSGVGHTVALERGSIRAEVVPREPSEGLVEAFVVEAQRTRVAVHGTAFSVTLEGDRAVVDVEHGAVAVGPIGHVGATTGHLLVGPTRASFSLDGARSAKFVPRDPTPEPVVAAAPQPAQAPQPEPVAAAPLPPAAPVHAPQIQPIAPGRAAAPPPAPEPQPEPAVAPAAPAPPLLTVASVRARVDQCFRSTHDVGSSGVQLSVSSTLRVTLRPDGSVLSARFDPPLKPEMSSCAGSIMSGRFAEGTPNVDIPVVYRPQ